MRAKARGWEFTMKKGFITRAIIFMAVIVCSTSFMAGKKEASAANSNPIPLQKVADIDNFPYPSISPLYYVAIDYRSYSEFTIDSPGQVKATFHLGVNVKGTGNAWISRDENGVDIVGSLSKFTGTETSISWFLESGTYYLNSIWSDVNSQVNVALLYEASNTGESVHISDFDNSNLIVLENSSSGFLSATTPSDYYSFVLKERANVTVEYSFDAAYNTTSDTGICTLYDEHRTFLKEGTYSNSDKGAQKLICLLEPGTYFIKLNGLLGNTKLYIKPMYYDIVLTPAIDTGWTKKPMKVEIETSIDYSEIMVLYKDAEETVLNNSKVWANTSEFNIKLDGETFEATKSGIYSVRITDNYGNNTMQKINVTAVDVTKPKVTGVTDKKAYSKPVTITWTDKQSGINTSKTTLNGKIVSSGIKVTAQGKYTLKVYDKIGNYRTVVFYVDSTAPTADVENGKTYSDTVTLKFKDNVSGLKKIIVDDKEESVDLATMRCYYDGTYTVKMWDNAGNYRKIVFYIKKTY